MRHVRHVISEHISGSYMHDQPLALTALQASSFKLQDPNKVQNCA